MADFDYKQRAATPEYRENWDRVFGVSPTFAPAEVLTIPQSRVLAHRCRCGNDRFRANAQLKLVCTECGEDLW
jgi:hypothetical protein